MVPHFTYLSYRILLFILFVVEALEYCFWNGILRLQILLEIMMLLDPTTWLIPKKKDGNILSLFLSPSLFPQYAPIVSPATAHRSSQKHPPSRRLCIQWPSFHPLSKTNHSMTHFLVSHHFSVCMCFTKLCICLRSEVQRHFICAFGYGKILLAV